MEINPIYQSFIACLFTFIMTIIGSGCIYLVKKINHNIMGIFLSIAAGIMLSSSIFSLIIPALNFSNDSNYNTGILLSIGILTGTIFIFLFDIYYKNKNKSNNNNLILSMTLHNFPEGMAIGVAFASITYNNQIGLLGAISIAIGIGIQNFPEGASISFPLYSKGYSKFKAFIIGGLTAIVEPIGGIIGALIALKYPFLLPFLLSLAAGSMLYVITSEIIPEVMANKNKEQMALYLIIGFIIMMYLDISL